MAVAVVAKQLLAQQEATDKWATAPLVTISSATATTAMMMEIKIGSEKCAGRGGQ